MVCWTVALFPGHLVLGQGEALSQGAARLSLFQSGLFPSLADIALSQLAAGYPPVLETLFPLADIASPQSAVDLRAVFDTKRSLRLPHRLKKWRKFLRLSWSRSSSPRLAH